MVRKHQTRNPWIPGSMLSHRPEMTLCCRAQKAFRQGLVKSLAFLPAMLPYAQFSLSGAPLPEILPAPAGFKPEIP
jgi:hypothetical protein